MKQPSNIRAGGSALFTLVSGIVILLAVVFFCIKLAGSGSFGDVAATTESATQTRIQPVGQANAKAIRFSTKSVSNATQPTASSPMRPNLITKAIGRPVSHKASTPCSNTL